VEGYKAHTALHVTIARRRVAIAQNIGEIETTIDGLNRQMEELSGQKQKALAKLAALRIHDRELSQMLVRIFNHHSSFNANFFP
jgi:hypothetical protein